MLFRKKIDRYCSYCTHSAKIDDDTVLCKKKGIRSSRDHCMRFTYDPLKRCPKRMKPADFVKFSGYDFSL